jgi:hypothetical protein
LWGVEALDPSESALLSGRFLAGSKQNGEQRVRDAICRRDDSKNAVSLPAMRESGNDSEE